MNFLSLPSDFPGISEMQPGEKKEVLVQILCSDEEYDEGAETKEYQVLKVDGVPLDEIEKEEVMEDDMEDESFMGMLSKPNRNARMDRMSAEKALEL